MCVGYESLGLKSFGLAQHFHANCQQNYPKIPLTQVMGENNLTKIKTELNFQRIVEETKNVTKN